MIELTHRGGIAVVTMNHGKANALDIEFCEAIAAQVESLRGSETKAIVLTGQGAMFSAGVNLIRLSEGSAPYVRRFLPALHRLYDTLFFFPKPVVAAVNGHAIAGGCVLHMLRRQTHRRGRSRPYRVTELLVGVPFPPLAFEIMRFATPPAFFRRDHHERRDLSARHRTVAPHGRRSGKARGTVGTRRRRRRDARRPCRPRPSPRPNSRCVNRSPTPWSVTADALPPRPKTSGPRRKHSPTSVTTFRTR